ncbi:MAG: LPS assembly lipoprotein LptE [Verrucomicrobiota bacterium]|nr:LPS assembly lipoprotein LptE [Verrucomicrobiota bacterium]
MRLGFWVPALALFFSGCAGYSVGPIKPKLMREVDTIAVSSFQNETLEPRMEVLLANAVIKQLQQDGTYRIANEASADALLEGTLQEIDRRPARSVRGNVLQTREFDLVVRVRYRVVDRVTGKELDARTVTGSSSFFVSGSTDTLSADVNQDERQALPLAAEDLAERLVSQVSEGW